MPVLLTTLRSIGEAIGREAVTMFVLLSFGQSLSARALAPVRSLVSFLSLRREEGHTTAEYALLAAAAVAIVLIASSPVGHYAPVTRASERGA